MILNEVKKPNTFGMGGFATELQKKLNAKFGNLSTDDWSVFIEVDQPKQVRTMSGANHRWIRVWMKCYGDIGSQNEVPDQDLHLGLAIHLMPKEIKRIYRDEFGTECNLKDRVDDAHDHKVEYWWDIEL